MPKSQPCWPLKTLQNNLDNFKIHDIQIFMVDIFDGHIDVAIITGIDDMGMHTITAFNDFKAKIGKGETILNFFININLNFILA